MEIFIFILVILFILAVSDLIVGVGNDAVNFFNSAFGSKVAPRHIILLVASIGIVAGTLFSSGMMEVARKGIFNPEHFYFNELMTIFLAVMLTDVILLDFFNTFGLPTSTTVSIVFELLGAAVAVSLIKISNNSEDLGEIITYINTSKAIAIISGILLSIVVAFTVGAVVQFFTRLVFTFDYKSKLNRYGGIFGGISLTAITFFIVIKGSKSASFMTEDIKMWISSNTVFLLLISFVVWAIIFQVLQFLKVNILKIIVFVGTFALALAFAANDLVNFIGVPLAGLHSFQIAANSPEHGNLLMEALKGKIASDPWLLIAAGFVMIGTIYFNKKARSVLKTSIDLGRQHEGDERFESSLLARSLVRMNISLSDTVNKYSPAVIRNSINKRFINSERIPVDADGKPLSFDLLRASVNLMVASILISIATSWKLPLSTTYVTFMVAMGSSLSDRAWGRDSAVYRINGVITVIGGWFFTAFIAFTISGVFASIIYFGELTAIILLSLLAVYFVFRTHIIHKNKSTEETSEEVFTIEEENPGLSSFTRIAAKYSIYLETISTALISLFTAFTTFDRNAVKEAKDGSKAIKKSANKIVSDIVFAVRNLPDKEVKKGRRYGKMMGATQEISLNYRSMVDKMFVHIDNNHRPLNEEQNKQLIQLKSVVVIQIEKANEYINAPDKFEEFVNATAEVNEQILKIEENNVTILRNEGESFSTRGNMLYLDIISGLENISSQINHLISVLHKNYLSLTKDKAVN